MDKLTVSRRAEKKLRSGRLLLDKEDFSSLAAESRTAELYSQQGNFLGTAYLSPQNKGAGWLVARERTELTEDFFRGLFAAAKNRRRAYRDRADTDAYRLFNQDGDGFGGLTVDLYADYAVFSWYNTFVFQIKDRIAAAFRELFPEIRGAYEKIRFKGPDYESAHLYGQEAPSRFTVKENGVRYQVFLNDGLMTGIFLDQHEVRRSLAEGLASGQHLLNLFSYTAAFSVAAAWGGASQTTSVDLAKRSRELSEAHFAANNLDTGSHRFVVMDVFDYFRYAKRHGLLYDIIVIDPPSFARSRKRTFSAARDYHRLIVQALSILAPGGLIIASTNAANLSRSKFKQEIEQGFAGVGHRYLAEYGLPADFQYNKMDRSSNYLKVFTIKVEE